MKRCNRILPAFILLAGLLGGLLGVQAADVSSLTAGTPSFSIEQTYVNAPELDIFLYANDGSGGSISPTMAVAAGVEATLGEHKLDASNISVAAEPICYIFLLDDSNSMTEASFTAYKNAIAQVARTKNERDQVVVYTMAGSAKMILGESSTARDVYATLKRLSLSTESCNALEAATKAVQDMDTNFQSLAPRKALFLCTNSMQLVSNPALVAGLSTGLTQNLNMALYAFSASESHAGLSLLDTLTSGRVILVDDAEVVTTVRDKMKEMATALEIKTTVPDALSGKRLEELTIRVPSMGSAVKVSTNVYLGHVQAKPAVTGVSVDGRNQITLTFNQAVDDASSPKNYTIHSEDAWGWTVPVHSVALSQDGRTAVLATDTLYSGSYGVRLNKVASRMTAANRSDKTKTMFAIQQWPHDRAFYMDRFRVPAAILAALLIILVIRTLVMTRRERANETAAEVEHLLGGEALPVSALPKRWVTLMIKTRGAVAEKRCATLVENSAILGSDENLCDVCVEDHRIKPQHCVLWLEGEDVYVRALDKNSAVYCNRERIADAHRVEANDVLTIGRTTIQIVL